MFYLTKEFRFEAAHHLLGYEGPCACVHGHSYKLQVTVGGNIADKDSLIASDCMVMDFNDLSKLVKTHIISDLDHTDLNDKFNNPTAEVIAYHIYNALKVVLPVDIKCMRIRLWETDTSFVEYGSLNPHLHIDLDVKEEVKEKK